MTDFIRKRGDTYPDEFVITSKATGEAININGASFLMTLNSERKPVDTNAQIYQLTGVITDAVNGVVEFAPTAVQADQIGKFYFDVQMTDAQGVIRTIDSGKYTYVQDITK